MIVINGFYIFSDECGSYQAQRSKKFSRAHPFYVRASVLLDMSDYVHLETKACEFKKSLGIPSIEIKWSELGNRYKGRTSPGMEMISTKTLETYITHIVEEIVNLKTCRVFFSMFDNNSVYTAREQLMLKMHIQNALQRAQRDMEEIDGFATMIIDDISNEKNRILKDVCHDLLENGDFVTYTNVKKSILTDFSHHCAGLQLADYCAGIFTSCIKRINSGNKGYDFSNNLMFSVLYKKIRNIFNRPPNYETYRYGIKEVPNDCGAELCKCIASEVDRHLDSDLQTMLQSPYK